MYKCRGNSLLSYGAALNKLGIRDRQGNRPLEEQSCGEFAPAVPETGAGDAPFPAHAKSAETRLGSRIGLQPFQPGAPPLQQTEFQTQPRRCSRRVARLLLGLIDCHSSNIEANSHSSDNAVQRVVHRQGRLSADAAMAGDKAGRLRVVAMGQANPKL